MAAYEVGMRVGAVLSTDKTTARLFGFGVYDGPQTPPHGPCGLTIGEMSKHGPFTNPRITLDSGKIEALAQASGDAAFCKATLPSASR